VAKTDRLAAGKTGDAGLSDDELMTAALEAIKDAERARSALVQALKRKLASGELGTDSARLADRIIDDLLKN
jgi:anti-sigma28 factor (negative regulator of flagellin synthesis)